MADSAELADVLAGPVAQAAPRLLGAVLRYGGVAVRLTEVEAYGGVDDAGSHAHRGRTARNASMFERGGTLYCYLSYGTHVCANVATGPVGEGSAVLLRAGAVVEGVELARVRRPGVADRDLARGPGNLARSLGLTLELDGACLVGAAERGRGPVMDDRVTESATPVSTGPRVGLTREGLRPWRFWTTGDRTVSAYRRSPRLVSPPEPC